MKIVSFDPSISNFGCVAAEYDKLTGKIELLDSQTIRPVVEKSKTKALEDLKRFQQIYSGVHFWLDKHKPDLVCAELPIGSQSSRAMVNYSASIAFIASIKQPLIAVTPADVKKAVMVGKNASKAQIIEWVTAKHPSPIWKTRKLKGQTVYMASNEHEADAVVVIYAAMEKPNFKKLIGSFN